MAGRRIQDLAERRDKRVAVGKREVGFGGDVVGKCGWSVGLRARSACVSWKGDGGWGGCVRSGWQTRTRRRLSKSSDTLVGFSVGQNKKKNKNKQVSQVGCLFLVEQPQRAL